MILLVEPEHLIRPGMVALRGGGITLFSMLAFFSIAGIDRTQYVGAYLSAVVISFAHVRTTASQKGPSAGGLSGRVNTRAHTSRAP
jgi:hypothetical protein